MPRRRFSIVISGPHGDKTGHAMRAAMTKTCARDGRSRRPASAPATRNRRAGRLRRAAVRCSIPGMPKKFVTDPHGVRRQIGRPFSPSAPARFCVDFRHIMPGKRGSGNRAASSAPLTCRPVEIASGQRAIGSRTGSRLWDARVVPPRGSVAAWQRGSGRSIASSTSVRPTRYPPRVDKTQQNIGTRDRYICALDSAVVMRHTLSAFSERSFYLRRTPSHTPLNTHMILVP